MSEEIAKKRARKIRIRIAEAGVRYYALADELGISYNTLNRRLRHGIERDRFEEIVQAIGRIERRERNG